jgi:methylated-DNA-protein-cysteine methyltransferase related protein
MAERAKPAYRELVYELVLQIPAGRVMTYGQIARILGDRYDARAIGNVMHATPNDGREIPWHRVINARGGCSTAGRTLPPDLQQMLLEAEGVLFSESGLCHIDDYLWTPEQ